MKTPLSALFLSLTAALASAPAAGDSYLVYKVAANIPVVRVTNVGGVVKIETRKLTSDDLVNIGLDRRLGFPVDKKAEILAVAANEAFVMTPTAQLILWNANTQTATPLAPLSHLHFDFAELNKGVAGFGFGQCDVSDTPAGVMPVGKYFATTIFGGGLQKGHNAVSPFKGYIPAGNAGVTSLFGKLKFIYTVKKGQTETTDTFDGFVLNGMLKGSGKPLGMYSD